jgi:hypothetical protein
MKRMQRLCLATVLIGGVGGAALAQTPIRPPQPPNMPSPQSTIPEKIKPVDPSTTGSTSDNLSKKLEATDGVIKPPDNTAPGMVLPAPDPGTTRVIPPPGSPGGDQSIVPR